MHADHPEFIVTSAKFDDLKPKEACKDRFRCLFPAVRSHRRTILGSVLKGNWAQDLERTNLLPVACLYGFKRVHRLGGVVEAKLSLKRLQGHLKHGPIYCTGSSHWLELSNSQK